MFQWTPFSIAFFFIFFMAIEIMLLFALADEIGGAMVVLEIFASAALGLYFIKHNALGRLSVAEDMDTRKPIFPLIQEIVAFLIAGLLLILPGVITDFCGLLLAIPHLRWRFMDYFEQKGGMAYTKKSDTINKMFNMEGWESYQDRASPQNPNQNPNQTQAQVTTPVIEGEYYEVNKKGENDDNGKQ